MSARGRTPFLSAVLIVKDEEHVLGECLAALAPAVDEVVVYDTGSTDGTREVSAAHGARVVRGFWDDHFGRARNRALDHARGDWVVSIDADEVLVGDRSSIRRSLQRAELGMARLEMVATAWQGDADGHRSFPVRFFRRTEHTWVGALHEYVVPLSSQAPRAQVPLVPGVRIMHSGHQPLVFVERGKGARNLRAAASAVDELDASGEEPTAVWDAYGRALLVEGRADEAVEALDRVLDLQGNPSAVVQSGRSVLSELVQRRDTARAERWIAALARHGEPPAALGLWRGRLALALGDLDAADAHLHAAAGQTSDLPLRTQVDEALADLAQRQERPGEALAVLIASLTRSPGHAALAPLVQAARASSTPVEDVVDALPEAFARRAAHEALLLPDAVALQWLTALEARWPSAPEVLLVGSVLAGRGDLELAVAWSSKVRSAGLPGACPLRVIGRDDQRTGLDRALALALAAGVADEEDARSELGLLLADLPVHELVQVVPVVGQLVPAVGDVLLSAVDAALSAAVPVSA